MLFASGYGFNRSHLSASECSNFLAITNEEYSLLSDLEIPASLSCRARHVQINNAAMTTQQMHLMVSIVKSTAASLPDSAIDLRAQTIVNRCSCARVHARIWMTLVQAELLKYRFRTGYVQNPCLHSGTTSVTYVYQPKIHDTHSAEWLNTNAEV